MKKKQEVKGSFFENLKLRQKMSLIIGSVTFLILASLLYFLFWPVYCISYYTALDCL